MARLPTKSILGSLKGKIWFAVSGLAVLNCIVGVGVYLLTSFLVTDALVSIFLSFVISAFLTMVFGWWLANDVLDPLTKLTLAAKSLERSPTASLPRTTGSIETDELLDSINRTSAQIQELIVSMDEIAAGRISSLKSGTRTSDRLNIGFQNMVAKVADSVDAKARLDEFEKEIGNISRQMIRLRDGDLSIEIHTDLIAARGLTESVNYLAANLRQLTNSICENSKVTLDSSVVIRDSLRRAISDDDAKAGRTRLVVGSLAEMPDRLHQVSKEIAGAFERAGLVRELAEGRKRIAGSLSTDIGAIRAKVNDARRYIEILREHSTVLPNSARQATDISRRSNMLAINLAVKKNGSNGNGHLSLAADEIGTLSKKTAEIAKSAGTAGGSLSRELNALEEFVESLKTDLGLVADKAIAEAENHNEMEIGLNKLFELRERLPTLLPDLDSEHETSLAFLENSAGSVGSHLRETEEEMAKIERLSSELMASVGNFRHVNSEANSDMGLRKNAKEIDTFTKLDLEKSPADTVVNGYD